MHAAGPYARPAQSSEEQSIAANAAGALRKQLIGLYVSKALSAVELCTLCHNIVLATPDAVADLALRPGITSLGNYNAHVRLILGAELGLADLSYVEAPMSDSHSGLRVIGSIPYIPPSEWFHERLVGDQVGHHDVDMASPLPNLPPTVILGWTPLQDSHPVVVAARAKGVHASRIRRGGLYMDAAGFTKHEGFEGLFFNDLETGKRGLCAVVRKSELCNCGRRGFCTLWPLHEAVRHDLEWAGKGIWAPCRYDNTPLPRDGIRDQRAGLPMSLYVACTELRADWPGFSLPLGFRACNHKYHPCPLCHCTKETMGLIEGVALDGSGPWLPYTHDEYLAEVGECCIKVHVATPADQQAIMDAPLDFDSSDKGYLGRVLYDDVVLSTGEQLLKKIVCIHPSNFLILANLKN